MNLSDRARQIASLVDLTSLSGMETREEMAQLCARASGPWGHVAALCVFAPWVPFVRDCLDRAGLSSVPVATVVNFPAGEAPISAVLAEIRSAVAAGAAEIDLVFPYTAFMQGQTAAVRDFMRVCRENCPVPLKVILETGVLADDVVIRNACRLAMDAGADFLKTSTGKAAVHVTPGAAKVMLEAIAGQAGKTGFKASGGLRTMDDALTYLCLAEQLLGPDWVRPQTFRFGASGLLDDVLQYAAPEETR